MIFESVETLGLSGDGTGRGLLSVERGVDGLERLLEFIDFLKLPYFVGYRTGLQLFEETLKLSNEDYNVVTETFGGFEF
jgi:hypothetical protein